ncbi:LOW QUALITY PROTEIN: uncharacterized protein [Drosophila tropicalis]|uniref:LOW QUALITY PROTEIN: uncharacterized protein n=1 Tax=Drosophila tropicalis TaxID=46794 RepID=UPI0035AB6C77
MSLEMSKFYAGARAVVVNPPVEVERSRLSTLYHQVKPKEKQKMVIAANKKTLSSSKVITISNEGPRSSVGPFTTSTPFTSGRKKSSSVGAASAVQKVGTKGVTFLSRNKNPGKSVNALIMQNRRKHITDNSNQRHYQLPQKIIFSQGRRLPSQGAACNSMAQPDLKWIMRPLRNFKSKSNSSSEVDGRFRKLKCKEPLDPASYLTVKTSWPNDIRRCRRLRTTDAREQESKHSRVFCVPSQRIMLVDQLKQAQVHQIKAKRVRSQHKEQPKALKHEHSQYVQPEKAVSSEKYEVEETMPIINNSEILKKQHEEKLKTFKENCDLNQKVSIGCTSISSGSYQTTISCSSTSCHESDSIGKMWSSGQKFDTRIIEHNGKFKSIKLTSTVIKIIPKSSVEKNAAIPLQRKPINVTASHGPGIQLNTHKHKPLTVSLPQLATCTPKPKIVCVEQHKIPRTMEDGIDMSYQYFVSTPLKRGKRPQTIRYLYRPMVRSLNNSHTKQLRRLKKIMNIMNADIERTLTDELEVPQLPNTSSALSMPGPEPQHIFKPPPLKINAKYRPLLEKLSKIPFPTELPKKQLNQGGSGDAHLERLDLPSFRMPATQLEFEAQDGEIQPSLLDYHPNATRLDSKSGAYISYHSPLHFQRMTAGRAAYDTRNRDTESSYLLADVFSPTIAAVTFDDIELQISQQPSATNKSVSFQLNDPYSNSISNGSCIALDKKILQEEENQ